ncbi:hypothetical protein O6H91_13G095100 [Diphasiastrum complanatum]|uniref:Uncharacterized protein n=2 Tax=Diphasiastrum complanatum TaxID=34168 RepID=A0ACC2BXE7_DIPCM|nr:hypothetical protein O6H91_13G094800 [Diphasiastrum complanatum]KAJ7534448.1 hypothetical protein O6H91_13G095100 [Diphasiastrum complanatum]
MEASHCALLMDYAACPVPDLGCHDRVNLKELKHLLVRASLELESARISAKTQEQFHQARIKHLEELLKKAEQERDEANKGLQLLLNRVSLIPSLQSSLTEFEEAASHGQAWLSGQSDENKLCSQQGHLNLSQQNEHKVQLASRQQNCQGDQLEQSKQLQLFSRLLDQQQFHSPQQSEQLHSQIQPVHRSQSNLLQEKTVPRSKRKFEFDVEQHFAQSASSVQFDGHPAASMQEDGMLEPWVLSNCTAAMEGSSEGVCTSAVSYPCFLEENLTSQAESLAPSISGFSCASAAAAAFSATELSSAPVNASAFPCSYETFKGGIGSGSTPCFSLVEPSSTVVPKHLPEPPEADPQVMLKSLPEKGKLLQAVMQAGPLLQTLLLAGPVPQWQHPPPALDAFHGFKWQ